MPCHAAGVAPQGLHYSQLTQQAKCHAYGVPLQVVLYHQEACEAISDDALLELCDWCYRQLLFLNKDAAEIANTKGEHLAALPFLRVALSSNAVQ